MLASLESGRWVSEERYEMVSFSPAVRNIRREKEATTGEFRSELFRGESVNSTVSKHKSLLATRCPQSILLGKCFSSICQYMLWS